MSESHHRYSQYPSRSPLSSAFDICSCVFVLVPAVAVVAVRKKKPLVRSFLPPFHSFPFFVLSFLPFLPSSNEATLEFTGVVSYMYLNIDKPLTPLPSRRKEKCHTSKDELEKSNNLFFSPLIFFFHKRNPFTKIPSLPPVAAAAYSSSPPFPRVVLVVVVAEQIVSSPV